ncbi:TniQ family protein [Streptomyces anulatus]|uniref:TniQ family protein n=1 Tax=Streptomyces anulatus TaxID=1892 RepID=UPI0033EB24DA
MLGLGGFGIRARGVFPAWLLTTSTRYCPECLVGDGSPIQQRHGGPWQSQWRMATNFACLEHRSFLRTTCPACELPAQMIRATPGASSRNSTSQDFIQPSAETSRTPGQGPAAPGSTPPWKPATAAPLPNSSTSRTACTEPSPTGPADPLTRWPATTACRTSSS